MTCLSGRKSSPRKRVWCKPPWVQIPPSPPESHCSSPRCPRRGFLLCLCRGVRPHGIPLHPHRSAGFPAVRQPSRRPPVSPVGTPALRSSACLPGVCLPCRRECLSCGRMLALQRRHTTVRQANRGSADCAGRGVGGILGSSWSQVGYPEHWSPRAPDKSRWVTKWKPALNVFVITAVSAGGVSPWTARSTHPTTHEHGNCDQSRAQLSSATSRSHHRTPEPRKSCRLFDVAPRILTGSPGCAGEGDQRRWR